jgi:hypothetical protein
MTISQLIHELESHMAALGDAEVFCGNYPRYGGATMTAAPADRSIFRKAWLEHRQGEQLICDTPNQSPPVLWVDSQN